jgi:hypothetical protein
VKGWINMKLYLDAKSKNNTGYTPDWLKIDYEENDCCYTLTLDLQGDIDYNEDTLSCRYKGALIPWTLYYNETGDECNFYEMDGDKVESIMPVEKIISIIENGTNYTVGIYPVFEKDFDLAEDDELNDCHGSINIYYDGKEITKDFVFETELNIY